MYSAVCPCPCVNGSWLRQFLLCNATPFEIIRGEKPRASCSYGGTVDNVTVTYGEALWLSQPAYNHEPSVLLS